MKHRRAILGALGRGAAAAALALLATALFSLAAGVPPADTLRYLATGAFGSPFAWKGTLLRATPILLTGLAVAWAFRAGLFNIGAEGQLLWGAVAAAWVGTLALPAGVHPVLALLAGAGAGALWAWPAALLKVRRGAPEVLTTLLLSFVAGHLTMYLANHPLHGAGQQGPRTADIHPTARLDFLPWAPFAARPQDHPVHSGLLLALACAVLLFLVLSRGRFGFQLRATGLNPEAARSCGIRVPRIWSQALLQSGALAGLAGAVEVLGVHRYFQAGFSPGYGYEGIAVAILGANSPAGVALAALFWGGLANGAVEMELSAGVNRYLVTVIQALVVLAVAVRRWPALHRLSAKQTMPEG